MMIEKPFKHYVINDFLNATDYAQLVDVYSKLKFYEKQSDLFHFFQTNQLADEPSMSFFKQQLNKQFSKLMDLKDTSYNIFASYYFEGDYLLCHDDVIEDRKFAFSYYLQDHPSADLVFYDDTATKQAKRIKVTKNVLAIFQVSNISHHQVAYCKQNGRKAVTGWINIKGLSKNRVVRIVESFKPIMPKQILKYALQQNLQQEEYYHFPEIQYSFDAQSEVVAGPFYERKATRLVLENSVVFDLKGYELFSADFFKFDIGDYILLNDPINTLAESVLDVFIVKLPEGAEDSEQNLIQIIDQNGTINGGIPAISNSVFIVHRNKKNYYIDRAQQQFFLGHLIYNKVQAKGKTKAIANSKQQIKLLRQKLIRHIDEGRQDKDRRQVPTVSEKTKSIKKHTSNTTKSTKKKTGAKK